MCQDVFKKVIQFDFDEYSARIYMTSFVQTLNEQIYSARTLSQTQLSRSLKSDSFANEGIVSDIYLDVSFRRSAASGLQNIHSGQQQPH